MTHVLLVVLISLIKTIGLIFIIILPMVSYTVYAERRVSAMIQDRLGPNRVGIPLTLFGFQKDIPFFGLAQPIADAMKLLLKEDFTPTLSLLRDKGFQDLLVNYPRPPRTVLVAYEAQGEVSSTRLIRDGQRIRVHGTDGYVEILP